MEDCECPVCLRKFSANVIELHANKCIFLNTQETVETPAKRKRSLSPSLLQRPSSSSYKNIEINEAKEDLIDSSKKLKSETTKADFSFAVPLAKQVQPNDLNDFVGQKHVFGENNVLRTLFDKGDIPNMILWGPPGCGKTSLAGVVQGMCKKNNQKLRFVTLSAVNSGVNDVQSLITVAKNELKYGRRTILFMDEIHRFNKRQQDTFLLNVEKGDIILIGATTENPSFSLNNALLSRCRVIVFEKLDSEALVAILLRAVKKFESQVDLVEDDNPHTYDATKPISKLSIEKSALQWLADISDGDARIALTNLQLILQHNSESNTLITVDDIKEGMKKSHMLYDRKGEEHYNIISALHKSIRGSDVNAAVYWLTRMIVSGEDPLFIARRLVRAASEDIGNQDPLALQLAVATMQGCQLIGMPECDVLLTQCTIYLARAPKSREADDVLRKAKKMINDTKGPQPSVPLHLRNAPTKLMKELGYGGMYKFDTEPFMPAGYKDVNFFD